MVASHRTPSVDGWTRFTEGECLHFVLKDTKLMMYSTFKNRRFVIDDVLSGDQCIGFIIVSDEARAKLTLEPLTESEYDKLVS
jgi:hypothetical protein